MVLSEIGLIYALCDDVLAKKVFDVFTTML